jgi:hypothetical protein
VIALARQGLGSGAVPCLFEHEHEQEQERGESLSQQPLASVTLAKTGDEDQSLAALCFSIGRDVTLRLAVSPRF